METHLTGNGTILEGSANSSFIFREIWPDNQYTKNVPIFPGDTVIDIGANQGFFAAWAAERGANAIAVEPMESNFQILKRNASKYGGRVVPVKAALGSENGEMELYMPKDGHMASSAMASGKAEFLEHLSQLSDSGFRRETVRTMTLDSVVESLGLGEIKLIKVDCEGFELDVFRGLGSEISKRVANVAIETHEGYDQKDLCDRLIALGFKIGEYQRPTGLYMNGFIWASRDLPDSVRLVSVAQSAPAYDSSQDTIRFDASKSFSLGGSKLIFRWRVNGCEYFTYAAPTLALPALGKSRFECEVHATDESGGISGMDRIHYWIPKKEAIREGRIVLNELGKDSVYAMDVNARFVIPSSRLPKKERWEEIVIGIAMLAPSNTMMTGFLSCLGERFPLGSYYSQIVLPGISVVKDLEFEILETNVASVKITWWNR